MAFIDMVEWKPQSNDIFAWRFPESNLSTATQLIVRESQEAVFFSKGQILGKFGPGKHKLTTENLPLLRNLFGIPFGGKNPFTAEVWFVNKAAPLTIDWKTTSMRFMDPDYGQMIPLVASGRYGLKVIDAEKFLVQLVGTLNQFTSKELTDHFMGPLVAKTNSSIVSFMSANRVGINQIAAHLDELSKFIGQPMAEFWEAYGFSLTGFYITSVDLDTSTPDGKKISDALSDRSAQSIAGYTWQQKQSFGMANNAVNQAGNSSNGGMGIMGVAMMAGAFGGGGGGMGSAMMQPPNQAQYAMGGNMGMTGGAAPINKRAEVFCSNCAKKYPTTSRFCPHCGDPYNPCPACGADNSESAKRCVSCGTMLQVSQNEMGGGNVCSKCGNPVQTGIKFCPTCGNKLM
ncbi:MAG: SPFH domain-containing protein [Treponema sp.]|nr:SPFH domain-containing protein [Treponema sp.]